MHIQHSDFHRWHKDTVPDPLEHFGKNSKARVRSTLDRINEYDIKHIFAPLNMSFFKWFKPLYEERIGAKQNGKIYDVINTTINKTEGNKKYYSLSLYEDGVPVGGTIFSFLNDKLSTAYRMYEHDWFNAKLPANPSFYTEYLLSRHAYEAGVPTISHGKDRNPYGVNSSIGLGMFKLAVGCKPSLPATYETLVTDTDTLSTDALIMQLPESGEAITSGVLVTSRETESKYQQLYAYAHLLRIETVYRD